MNVDYLIVGQGLAGSILADKLLRQKYQVMVVDNDHLSSSSIVAAGIMNPITGRRFVKSWMYDQFYGSAIDYYKNRFIESDVLKELPIYRLLKSAGEENDWLARSQREGWSAYMDLSELKILKGIQSPFLSLGVINRACTIDTTHVMTLIKNLLIQNNSYFKDEFDYDQLIKDGDYWNYKDIKARNIIFCEGSKIITNPYFNHLPMVPAKGELLIIKSANLADDMIIKADIMIVPLKRRYFWVGATYQWDYETDLPSEVRYDLLLEKLDRSLNVDYKIYLHSAAIRPTVKDRRPLLGRHFSEPSLWVFNGFGTKGASMIPYFADLFIEALNGQKTLMEDVDCKRFEINSPVKKTSL